MDRELLLEIGCEEIPASWLLPLSRQLGERLAAELVTFRISRKEREINTKIREEEEKKKKE